MATIVKTPSGTWKAVIRKTGFPTTVKTFRLKRDAEDWARTTEDEMVRGQARHMVAIEADQHGIHAVEAGARHQPDKVLGGLLSH